MIGPQRLWLSFQLRVTHWSKGTCCHGHSCPGLGEAAARRRQTMEAPGSQHPTEQPGLGQMLRLCPKQELVSRSFLNLRRAGSPLGSPPSCRRPFLQAHSGLSASPQSGTPPGAALHPPKVCPDLALTPKSSTQGDRASPRHVPGWGTHGMPPPPPAPCPAQPLPSVCVTVAVHMALACAARSGALEHILVHGQDCKTMGGSQ